MSRLIAISTEWKEIEIKLEEINSEIKFESDLAKSLKTELAMEDAEEFINDHVWDLLQDKPLKDIFSSGGHFCISYEEVEPFWTIAKELVGKIENYFDECEDIENIKFNVDDLPIPLANELDHFEYSICNSIMREIESGKNSSNGLYFKAGIPVTVSAITNQNKQKKFEKMRDADSRVKWLELQKANLLTRQKSLVKPKGTVLGLIVFSAFSIIGIIVPLCLMPSAQVDTLGKVVWIKCIDIGLFTVGLGLVIWYFVQLLNEHKS